VPEKMIFGELKSTYAKYSYIEFLLCKSMHGVMESVKYKTIIR